MGWRKGCQAKLRCTGKTVDIGENAALSLSAFFPPGKAMSLMVHT